MSKTLLQKIEENRVAKEFSKKFIKDNTRKKYLFGRNIYANKIIEQIEIDGFIDDFYKESEYLNKQVIKLKDIPKDALVLVLSGGNTKSALKRVKNFNLECLDYFSFYNYANIDLTEVYMNEDFRKKYDTNHEKFEKIYSILADKKSKEAFFKVVNFRYSYDLKYLEGFQNLENKQYFENLLDLQDDEVFLDVGGFDGYTSEEFIKICPNYKAVYVFEPEDKNLKKLKNRLKDYKNINIYKIGLSSKKEILKFDINGSASKVSNSGKIKIKVDRLDDILKDNFTFLKMDIEGAEKFAIEGATESIRKNHPKLAISVYHNADDLWKIPEQILSIRNDYKIYLRHYTESIYETVMFFIPNKKGINDSIPRFKKY